MAAFFDGAAPAVEAGLGGRGAIGLCGGFGDRTRGAALIRIFIVGDGNTIESLYIAIRQAY